MIYSSLTVTISGGQSKINEKIILYRGDREIQVSFEIIQAAFKFAKGENLINAREAGYGQLIIEKPDGTYIFSDMTQCEDGKVIFTITAEMIDELTETGLYSIQIRLFDDTSKSRITLPPIENAIEVREPIAAEDVSEAGVVGVASIDYAILNEGDVEEEFFDEDGMYRITYWHTGDRITEGRMNKIEDAMYTVNHKVENIDIPVIPTNISQLTNDSGYLTSIPSEYVTDTELDAKGYLTSIPSEYVTDTELNDKGYLTEHQSLDDYATKSYVSEEIAKAQLEGEDVDLSSYATKAEIPTKVSELENDKNYLTSIPSEYVTDTELNDKGYLTEHQSLDDYATKSYVSEEIAKAQLEGEDVDLSSYATKAEIPTKVSELENDKNYLTSVPSEYVTDTELNDKGYLTEHQSLDDYATKDEIPTNISQLTNDSGYLTSIPSEYVTDTELDAKGYLTEHQSLTDYATKSYVDEAINALRTELMALINSGVAPESPEMPDPLVDLTLANVTDDTLVNTGTGGSTYNITIDKGTSGDYTSNSNGITLMNDAKIQLEYAINATKTFTIVSRFSLDEVSTNTYGRCMSASKDAMAIYYQGNVSSMFAKFNGVTTEHAIVDSNFTVSSKAVRFPADFTKDQLHTYVVTGDATTLSFYIDGNLIFTETQSGMMGCPYIGMGDLMSAGYYNNKITVTKYQIYNVALNAEQVAYL